ncbi:MAG: DUF1592 domain-containing protein [Verrucomicrobiota bacterium]
MIPKQSIAVLVILAVLGLPLSAQGDPYAPIQPFLEKYCVECHGEGKQKAEVRLDDFDAIDGALWSEVYDQIHHADMPPEDEAQPSDEERTSITKLVLNISRDDAYSISTGFRRLNRREYANTVRDLLGLKKGVYDPAVRIFEDEVDHGFDTNAAELVISNELLLEYLDSAERSLRMALFLKDFEPPATKRVAFHPSKIQGGDRRFTTHKKKSTVLRGGGQYFAGEDSRRIEVAGHYRITITAAGVDRDNYGTMKFRPEEGPIRMGIGVSLDGSGDKKARSSELLKTFDLQDEEFKPYETELWLEPGAYPFVSFMNGSGKPASSIRQAIRQRKVDPKEVSPQNYQGPGIEITGFQVEGPIDLEWPPATYRTVFQMDEMPHFEHAEVRTALLERFVSRAFRRPATEANVQDYLAYLHRQQKRTDDWHEAFIKTFAAVMASHDFLYIKEEIGQLPPYELANRLSYFLWSSMPDQELLELAQTGKILETDVYATQVDRMLLHPRADELVQGFATQWLSLDLLGTMPPDIKDRRYAAYLKRGYEGAFRAETLHFFRHVLFENQPVGDFLDSDYTFLNDTLAEVYELPFEGGSDFQRVTLPAGSVRGGLVGHGSIHALTSNGVETLPVTRGHWVLDELLGDPPPPPPEEVPALVPDLNGLDTPRDQLVRHREDPACFACHKVMDPLGLALESFDVIGRYRADYEAGGKIDASGEVFGASFEGLPQLRKLLRTREREFAKSLTIKLAEYAKGRTLNRRDLETVDRMVAEAEGEGYRFQSMLRQLLMSELLRHR